MSFVPKIYKDTGGDRQVFASGAVALLESGATQTVASGAAVNVAADTGLNHPYMVRNRRFHVTIAQINAGYELLPAISGYKYRIVACKAVAVGGAAGAVTTVDILGTLTSSRKLVAFAQASLTQSAVLTDGGTGAAVLADGASYSSNDANTAITIGKTGSDVTTATHVDVVLSYVIEAA